MKTPIFIFAGVLLATTAAHAEGPCFKDSLERTLCQPDGTNAMVKAMGHQGDTGGSGCHQDASGIFSCDDQAGAKDPVPVPPVSPQPSPDETGVVPEQR